MTIESFLELFTTVPFFIIIIFFHDSNKKNPYIYEFFIMMDQARLFLYNRYTDRMKSPIDKELVSIALSITFIAWVMASFVQFVENEDNFVNPDYS